MTAAYALAFLGVLGAVLVPVWLRLADEDVCRMVNETDEP